MIGADIGTQTILYTSDTEAGLKNLQNVVIVFRLLKERATALSKATGQDEQQILIIMMVLLKGRKIWVYSNHYKLKAKHTELCRIG